MAIAQLKWGDPDRRTEFFNMVRHRHRSGDGFSLHRHDFGEVMWIEAGGYLHTCNGVREVLGPGDLRCLRPADEHGGQALERGGVMLNVAFTLSGVRHLARRHGTAWPWHADGAPRGLALSGDLRDRLEGWCADLAWPGSGQLDLECFLLDVARTFSRLEAGSRREPFPMWLREALLVFVDRRHLPGGAARLAHLAGRSASYLNRTVRAVRGCTTTVLVTELRLDWVACRLRLSDESAADIARAAGFLNRTHFYRLFTQRFAMTPKVYRHASGRQIGTGFGSGTVEV